MMMINREPGFYWVQYWGKWQVAEYDDKAGSFSLCGRLCNQVNMDEIDERRITREEQKS